MTLTSMVVGAAVPGSRLSTSLPTAGQAGDQAAGEVTGQTAGQAGGQVAGQAAGEAAGEPIDRATVTGVLKILAKKQTDDLAAVRAAQALGTEKSAPAAQPKHGGLGLVAPLTDLGDDEVGSMNVDSLHLEAGNGPASTSGDWNLMPEVLYAIVPLLMAGAAVATHTRRNAAAAPTVGVIRRRRHASE
jgi:hypothetical protein